MSSGRNIILSLALSLAVMVTGCIQPADPAPAGATASPRTAAATPGPATPLPTQMPSQPAEAINKTAASPNPDAAEATDDAPVTYIMSGDDYGFPSPFAFYNRGPGYIRMSYLFDTLVWKDDQGYIPLLAESWDLSQEGTRWTFRIRQGVRWHDGQPLTAQDVAFTYAYFREKAARGMVKWGWPLDKIETATVADDGQNVVITTAAPVAGLMTDLFGSLPIIPQHIWESVHDPLQKLDQEAVIGSSLFELTEYNKEQGRYVYQANSDYFLGKPTIDELVFIRVQDPALSLLAGEIDEASFSGKGIASVEELHGHPEFDIIQGPSDWTLKLYFNAKRSPLDERIVRQAIAHAIDRREIVDKAQMGGAQVASTGLMSPGSYWFNPNLPTYDYDPGRAQAMLNEAGIQPFEVTLLTTENYARDAELVKKHLAAIGITVIVKTADRSTVDSLLTEGDLDLLITGHGGAANPDIDHPSNEHLWTSAEYERVYDLSTSAVDDVERRVYAWQMQEIIANELPILPLWHPTMWEVYRPGGVRPFYTPEGVDGGIPLVLNKLIFLSAH